ncbi:polysaccharide deacetylase family protein [Paenibacillus puldeungensis]|uniref:Polysaccharide deacetylase family protein n=1 Tax=Paenibacillus puldeungensis TaxID=696536 RepID=A0ABW3S2B5_9BACL
MNENLAIMYHYIQIKGKKGIVPLEPEDFMKQLEWVTKNYEVVEPDRLLKGIPGKKPFCILTFDDAIKDQYEVAFNILKQKGLPGYFTVLSSPLTHRVIPVVHLVHAVLSYFSDEEIWNELSKEYVLDHIPSSIGDTYAYENDLFRRYNKYALNFVLSEELSRRYLEKKLSQVFTEIDKFIEQYYISLDEWRKIKEAGMTIGIHAVNHKGFSGDAQCFFDEEIAPCREFIRNEIGIDPKWYTPAYGGGMAYEKMMHDLEPILRREGLLGGFTTQHGLIMQGQSGFWFNRVDCAKLTPINVIS